MNNLKVDRLLVTITKLDESEVWCVLDYVTKETYGGLFFDKKSCEQFVCDNGYGLHISQAV